MRTSIALIFTLALIATDAGAATVQEVVDPLPTISITGPIIKGDFDKFQKAASTFVAKNMVPLRVTLNSIGGDVDEAIKIGRLARKLLVQVSVHGNDIIDPSSESAEFIRKSLAKDPSREYLWRSYRMVSAIQPLGDDDIISCYSACVLIFFGGTDRSISDNQDDRQKRRNIPVMGLHRPYYDLKYFSSLSPEKASKEYKRLEILVEEYLKEMGATGALMERMLRKASNDVELVTSKDFESFYRPVEPFLEEFLLAKCGSDANQEVLGPKELNDYELIGKGQIQEFVRREMADPDLSRNATVFDSYVPDGFDADYAALLQNKVSQHKVKVASCRKNAVLEHQLDWAFGFARAQSTR